MFEDDGESSRKLSSIKDQRRDRDLFIKQELSRMRREKRAKEAEQYSRPVRGLFD